MKKRPKVRKREDEIKMQRKFVVCDPNKCTGCRICEYACSAIKENTFNFLFSRIHVANHKALLDASVTCVQCEPDPPCVTICPREALTVNEESGIVEVEKALKEQAKLAVGVGVGLKCNGCGWCIAACEFGAAALDPVEKKTVICDLCLEEEEPACVKACPKEALSVATIEEVIERTESEIAKGVLKEYASARANPKTFYERLGFNAYKREIQA